MTWSGKPLAVLASLLALLVACTPARVETPPIPETITVPEPLSQHFDPPPTPNRTIPSIPLSEAPIRLPQAGDRSPFGTLVTDDLAAALQALIARRPQEGLAALERAESNREIGVLWQVSLLRIDMMTLAGRPADAEKEATVTARRERILLDHALNAMAGRGHARMMLGDLEAAFADFAAVVQSTRDWRLPVTYSGPPSNLTEIIALTAAQLRAFAGLARLYFRTGNYDQALAWADATEKRFNDVHYLAQNPEFGRLVPAYLNSYLARADNLLVRAAAGLALSQSTDRSLRDFSDVEAFYFRIGYRYGRISAEAMRAMGLLAAGQAEAALTATTVALNQAEEQDYADLAWRLNVIRGRALLAMDRRDEAAKAYQRAWASVQKLAGHPGADHDPTRFGLSRDEITYFLTQQNVRANDLPGTYEALERAIGSRHLHTLSHTRVVAPGYEDVLNELSEIDRTLHDRRLHRTAPDIVRRDEPVYGSDETALRQRRAALLAKLRETGPHLAALFTIEPPRLIQVRSRLRENAVLLYALPARGEDQIKWLLIETSATHLLTSAATASALREVLHHLRVAVRDRDVQAQTELIRRLTTLVSPAELIGDRLAYVIPSGIANLLPWGALDVRAPIVLLPTAEYLLDSIKAPDSDDVLVATDADSRLADQPGVPEARAVAALYDTDVLAEKNLTETELRQRIDGGARVLHFAGACTFDLRRPMQAGLRLNTPDRNDFSALFRTTEDKNASTANGSRLSEGGPQTALMQQFSPRQNPSAFGTDGESDPFQEEAGHLTVSDLYRNPLPVRLAVYSRCAVHNSRFTDGDGLLAFATSHRLGGTQAVLHSLWEVDEEARQAFMTTFHFQGQSGDWATAWLTARNTIRARGFPPGAVGAFVLIGDAWE